MLQPISMRLVLWAVPSKPSTIHVNMSWCYNAGVNKNLTWASGSCVTSWWLNERQLSGILRSSSTLFQPCFMCRSAGRWVHISACLSSFLHRMIERMSGWRTKSVADFDSSLTLMVNILAKLGRWTMLSLSKWLHYCIIHQPGIPNFQARQMKSKSI